jgi:hypothetical protein
MDHYGYGDCQYRFGNDSFVSGGEIAHNEDDAGAIQSLLSFGSHLVRLGVE